MTTQTAIIAAPSGFTLAAKLFTLADPDTVAFTADSVTERTNAKGQYVASFGEVSAISGDHTLILFSGSLPVAVGLRTFAGVDAEVATATLETVELDSDALREALGMEAADLDDQLDAILNASGGGSGSGSGARTVTITVDDGTDPLQNAIVRLTEGANSFRATTNVSGVAVFNVDDATYVVAITKSGYSYSGGSLVVDDDVPVTYSMDQVVLPPPSAPNLSVLNILCLDAAGAIEAGVAIDIRIITVPSGDQNIAYKGAKQTVVSGVNGIASLEAVRGATYEYKRGTRDVWAEVVIQDANSTDVESFIGSP